jgi:hypothetical protein
MWKKVKAMKLKGGRLWMWKGNWERGKLQERGIEEVNAIKVHCM